MSHTCYLLATSQPLLNVGNLDLGYSNPNVDQFSPGFRVETLKDSYVYIIRWLSVGRRDAKIGWKDIKRDLQKDLIERVTQYKILGKFYIQVYGRSKAGLGLILGEMELDKQEQP